MTFIFASKKPVSPETKAYAEKKFGKLDRYFKKDSVAHVSFSEERGQFIVEITIQHGAMYFRARESSQSYTGSIDGAVDSLVRQINKNKSRLEKRLRSGAFEAANVSEADIDEEETFDIRRTKRFNIEVLTPEEAILRMNMLGHQFFLFRNELTGGAFAVIYRRNDGGYGLIDTD